MMKLRIYLWGVLILASCSWGGYQKSSDPASVLARLQQAILNDGEQTYEADVHFSCPVSGKKTRLKVYKPHPDYTRITVLEGEGTGNVMHVYDFQIIRLNQVKKQYVIQLLEPRAEREQHERLRQALFTKQVRLKLLPQEMWEGQNCYVVEARAEGAFFKRYWLTVKEPHSLLRIQTMDAGGKIVREEQRMDFKRLPRAGKLPPPPKLPSGWQKVMIKAPQPASKEEQIALAKFQAPKDYHLLYTCRDRCPCGGPHSAACAIYSNGLNTYTLFLMDMDCADCSRTSPGGKYHITQTAAGLFATYRTKGGRLIVIVGEIDSKQVQSILTSAGK